MKHHGINLASMCVCCSVPKEESLRHLFLESDLAKSIWEFFGSVFGIQHQSSHSLIVSLTWWFHAYWGSTHFLTLGRMTAMAICWQIWSFHNNKIYGGMLKSFTHACLIVIDTLQFVEHLIRLGIISFKFWQDLLAMLGIVH